MTNSSPSTCKNHPFYKVLTLASEEAFNKELYGVEDLGISNYTDKAIPYVNSKIAEINARYNAELTALETQPQGNIIGKLVNQGTSIDLEIKGF